MGTDSDFYDRYTWFYPNAHKNGTLSRFFFFGGGGAENLKFVVLKSNLYFRNGNND